MSERMGSSVVSRDREGPQPREQQLSTPLEGNENLRRVRDFLATLPPERFNMELWGVRGGCGTVACIAGWATRVLDMHIAANEFTYARIGRKLGLDEETAHALFLPNDVYASEWRPTPDQAVQVLDNLRATGKVDWTIAAPSDGGSWGRPPLNTDEGSGTQIENPNQPGGEKL